MAKYNIYGHVLYSEIEYEKLMYITEKIFINALMSGLSSIKEWTDAIWNDIDHEYMITTLEEIKRDIIRGDLKADNTNELVLEIDKILKTINKKPDWYKLNPIEKFKDTEKQFGEHIADAYKRRLKRMEEMDELEYLTMQIKTFHTLEETIPYYDKSGLVARHVTPSTYLSMLYNVNLTRTGWNTTFKDAEYLGKDLVVLIPHPLSCPHCLTEQGKVFTLTGKTKGYPNIKEAYEHGVGHPNCKCEFVIVHNMDQLKLMTDNVITTKEDYIEDQKKKARERRIRRLRNDRSLYMEIGNEDEADKCTQKINRLING